MTDTLIKIEDLRLYFRTDSGIVQAVDKVSFTLGQGPSMVGGGESGCPLDFRPESRYNCLKKSEDLATPRWRTDLLSKLRPSKGEKLAIAARKPLYQTK